MVAEKPEALIAIGKCGAAHGVRGQVRVKSYTGDPVAIGHYGTLHLASGRKLMVTQVRVLKQDMLVATFAGVTTREAAEALAALELFVPRTALPAAGEEEFYHADLIGLAARTVEGAALGKVRAVLNFGAGDILEITPAGGGETLLFPFTRAVVPLLDVKSGSLIIVPPGEIEVPETRVTI